MTSVHRTNGQTDKWTTYRIALPGQIILHSVAINIGVARNVQGGPKNRTKLMTP